uniref:Heat shock transcription factor 2 n=1 Tax=Hippocampus comes TaxID=109280 RepID=A0A3Q2YPJ0_HIPCM
MKHNSNVPAFLTKLWTLVEDADTNELICWSQEGNSFLVLDEQRFAKEILPKFFKHNNMASFIRQLNMYGFRKVMHLDQGIVKQERDGPVEFQHACFKHGQDDLLENIKRKVSNTRPEETKIRQEDLSKILASVQSVHSKQENVDIRLATLKRENETLWTEISDLRQKHAHQQQLIKKLVHFIVTLVQNNHLLNLKRKRRVFKSSAVKKSLPHQANFKETTKHSFEMPNLNSFRPNVKASEALDDVIICDFTENNVERATDLADGDVEIVEVDLDACPVLEAEAEAGAACVEDVKEGEAAGQARSAASDGNGPTGGALQLNKASGPSLEDHVKMMDSILKENGAISQNINLLGKLELMDYLDSIDCSLEDFQAMLYGKPGLDVDPFEVKMTALNANKQLIQYTSCPLLAFLDGCAAPAELELGGGSGASASAAYVGSEPPSELMDGGVESRRPGRSSLVRLEPLTEAQASEETLFYLCELSPSDPDAICPEMDGV